MKKKILVFVGMLALTPVAAFANTGEGSLTEIAVPQDNITVKGTVVDETGSPIPGASIYVKGTTNGTISDIDGNFSLECPSDATLVFSYVGYTSQEIMVNNRTNLGTISMTEDNKELEQVVVIGYGTQKKVDLTGSVAIVDADEMKKVSNSNISTMLEGKIAGVQITSDGQPGADPNVRIRGIGSFNGTDPLYVVDGVPVGTTIRDFSPNDIATIQILKDASAAAIYGSRAANGVVIITTKSGKKNQAIKVDYSGYVGIDRIPKVYDVMGTDEFVNYIQTSAANSGSALPSGYDATSDNYFLKDGNYVNTDWFDAVFTTGVRQNHNVSFSGGGENNTYNVALDYFDQKGTIDVNSPSYKRYTVRVNNTMDVKFLKFRTGIVYSHSDQSNLAAGQYIAGAVNAPIFMASILSMQPTIKDYDESTWCLDAVNPAAAAFPYDGRGYGVYYPDIHGEIVQLNPLAYNSTIDRKTQVDRILGTATVTADLFDMFGFQSSNHKLSYNLNVSYNKTYCKDYEWVGSFFLGSTKSAFAVENEYLQMGYRQNTDGLIENTLNYEGTLAEKHHVNVVVGQTFESNFYHTITTKGMGYTEPYYMQIDRAEDRKGTSYESEHTMASYIGRLTYDFDGKYLLQATVRRDGSSRLSSEDRWGWFPSVSLGWRLDKENFFPIDEKYVNLFKIRGSYGILGNENIGEYRYMDTMNRNNWMYSFGGNIVSGSAISNYVNKMIAWEKKKSTSVGLDLGMLNGQVEFTFEWYKNVSEDLLYEVPIPSTTGVANATAPMNAAEMENSGFEWSATYHNYKHKVKYDISLNASTLKNKVVSLGFGNDYYLTGDSYTLLGDEIGQHYGYVYEGIIQSEEQLNQWNEVARQAMEARYNQAVADGNKDAQDANKNYATAEYQPGARVGDCIYRDINNDGHITTDDREILESGMPKFNFGLSGRIEYKGWDLSVSTFGVLGFHVTDYIYNTLTSCYNPTNKDPEVMAAGNPNVYYSATEAGHSPLAWNDLFSSRKIQNASYWKISNVELGYNFKDEWFHGIVSNVRAYVSGQNLATLTKYKGYNVDFAPGTFTPGLNYCSYPTPRTFMFGVKCTF
ncbi:MAG: TonB-dependent receptor [Bacteroidales bacterium]|nr:TonB-dependent receptor [Bacteroidales bacterium]